MLGIYLYLTAIALLGFVSCFFGKRFYFQILAATIFTSVIGATLSWFELSWKTWMIAVLIAAAVSALALFLYKLGVLLLGGVLGAGIGLLLAGFLPSAAERYHWVPVAVLALLLGVCALKWCDMFIMAATALHGGWLLSASLCFLLTQFQNLPSFVYADGLLATMANLNQYLNGDFARQYVLPLLAGTAVTAVIGFAWQYIAARKKISVGRCAEQNAPV